MKVELIAMTTITAGVPMHMALDGHSTDADDLAEYSGRSCYQSFHKPNPATRANNDYLANILAQGHESVLEHASCTFYIQGVSRALTHELIRHRHLSFSELSQRFVDVGESDAVVPPAIREGLTEGIRDAWVYALSEAGGSYDVIVQALTKQGYTRKQAREAARAVMPNATETKIVVTGNHRAWRDVLKKRWSVHADAEIRELAGELLRQLREIAPATYQDIPDEPYQ